MKLTIEVSDQAAIWLLKRAEELQGRVRVEVIAAGLIEQVAVHQIGPIECAQCHSRVSVIINGICQNCHQFITREKSK